MFGLKKGFLERLYTWSLGFATGVILVILIQTLSTTHNSINILNFPCYEDEFAWVVPGGYMCETVDDIASEVFEGGRFVEGIFP